MLKVLLLRYRAKTNRLVHIVVSSSAIKLEFDEFLAGIPNVEIYLVHSYPGGESGMLIVDEAHWVSNPVATRNSQVLVNGKAPIRMLLSATIDNDQRKFFQSHGFNHEFSVPLKTGVRLGIVPGYQSLNVPISFSDEEKKAYVAIQDKIAGYVRLFQIASPTKAEGLAFLIANVQDPKAKQAAVLTANKTGLPVNSIIGSAINFRTAVNKRAELLYTASEKIIVTKQLLEAIPEQKIIVFGSRLTIGDKLAKLVPKLAVFRGGVSVAAKTKAKAQLADFRSNKTPFLYGCNILNEGFTVNDASIAINIGIKSKALQDLQRTGRVLGLDPNNPDKLATKINLFIDDFTHEGKLIESQEKRWLRNAQKDQIFISTLTSVDELVDYIDGYQLFSS